MLELLFAISGWLSPTQEISLTGDIAFYRPGLMAEVIDTRGLDLGFHKDGVALMSCGDKGRTVWLEVNGKIVGPLLVVDCSQRDHFEMNVARGRVADISRELWDKLGLPEDLVEASVWLEPPRYVGRHIPI